MNIITIILVIIAYLIGSIPFAIIVTKAMALEDPRNYGSKNPGATNVLRSGDKLAAALTLMGDLLKGLIPVALVLFMAKAWGQNAWGIACVSVAPVLGHMFPIFLRFAGGKGVATGFGVILALTPLIALIAVIAWLIVVFAMKLSSLGAIVACVVAATLAFFLTEHQAYAIAIVFIAVLVLIRHHQNIRNLMAGTECKIGKKT